MINNIPYITNRDRTSGIRPNNFKNSKPKFIEDFDSPSASNRDLVTNRYKRFKKTFVRGIWHSHRDNSCMLNNMFWNLAINNPYDPENDENQNNVIYVFGRVNKEKLDDLGFKDVRLLDNRPCIWDIDSCSGRHLLEIYKTAMEDFDEITYLDINISPICPIPKDYWDVMYLRKPIQGPLNVHRRIQCFWRKHLNRSIMGTCFLYLREKAISRGLVSLWENWESSISRWPSSEDIVISKYLDSVYGEPSYIGEYWDQGFEPIYYSLQDFWHAYKKNIFQTLPAARSNHERYRDPKVAKVYLDSVYKKVLSDNYQSFKKELVRLDEITKMEAENFIGSNI
jgi:hypothetical protein